MTGCGLGVALRMPQIPQGFDWVWGHVQVAAAAW